MDSTLKQRIVGIVVLIALLGFCLTVLLRNTKTAQPHIAAINTHPSMLQTALETPATPAKPAAVINTPAVVTTTTNTDITPSTTTPSTPQPKLTVATLQPASVTVLPAPSPVTTTAEKSIAPAATITPAKSEKPTVSSIKPSQNIQVQAQAKTTDIIIPPPSELASTKEAAPATVQQAVQPRTEDINNSPTQPIQTVPHKRHVPASTTKKAPALDNQKDLVVQVGTFTIAGNAQTLVDKLHSKGFSAEAQKMKTTKGEMTRVIVGKKGLNHAQAETLRRELEKSMQLHGYIVSHAKG